MNQNTLANSSRLRKIRNVSRTFRVLLTVGVVLTALVALLALLQGCLIALGGKVIAGQCMIVHIGFSPNQICTISSGAPAVSWLVIVLGAIKLGSMACAIIACNRLFKLFEGGIFFAVENVRHVKALGCSLAAGGLMNTALELMAPQGQVDLNLLAVGALILLVAWIMDEGRKIKEEQELTV
jgi:hypothetical protein